MASILKDIEVIKRDPNYYNMMSSFAQRIIDRVEPRTMKIKPVDADSYRGNFSKLVTNCIGVSLELLPILLRLNGLKSSSDYDGNITILYYNEEDVNAYLRSNNVL